MVDRPHTPTLRPRRTAGLLALVAAAALIAAAPAAQARVVFPKPGVMLIKGLSTQLRAGEHFTLRGSLPDAVLGGDVLLQQESAPGTWTTEATAPTRPWIFWVHWLVPTTLGGQTVAVRFELVDGGKLLALSPTYEMAVTAPALTAGSRG